MNNPKVYTIIGNPDTGKTTTAWLIYLLLLEEKKATVEYFHLFREDSPEEGDKPATEIIFYDGEDGIKRPYDFKAIIILGDVRIAIYSPGDDTDILTDGFNWMVGVQPHIFINCCHSNWNSYVRHKLGEYEKVYPITTYHLRKDYEQADITKAQESRKELAEKIVENISNQNTK